MAMALRFVTQLTPEQATFLEGLSVGPSIGPYVIVNPSIGLSQ